jgi:hypothetical protein
MMRGAWRLAGVTIVAVALAGAPARADEGAGARLAALVEDVAGADAARYDARDDVGATLDGLDVVAVPGGGYAGVYHSVVGAKFATRVATSADLLHWTNRATLDTDSAQPSIAKVRGGGYVVVYEHGSTVRVIPRTPLPDALAGPTGLWMLNKNQLRFRFYPDLAALLAGKSSRQHTAPRRLSRTDEGTPDVSVRSGRTPADLVLDVTFHYFADQSGDGIPDADRQAAGTLARFRRWRAHATPEVDALFPGFAGNIGDRDALAFGGGRFVVHEAQAVRQDFGAWRLFLRDAAGGPVTPLVPRTAGGSTAFGNANVIRLPGPSGAPGLLFTAFVFSEGAAPGEAGALLAFHDLSG